MNNDLMRTVINAERAPTPSELSRWQEARQLLDRCVSIDRAAILLWRNMVTLGSFLQQRNRSIPVASSAELSALEQRLLSAHRGITRAQNLMRAVEDQSYGLRWTGSDFDVIEPQSAIQGFGVIPFIPIAIGAGVVVLAGLIARLRYLSAEAEYVRGQYNDILKKSDDALCKDPGSEVCKSWKQEKTEKKYEVNKTFSERIRENFSGVLGKGAGIALLVAAAYLGFSILGKRKP